MIQVTIRGTTYEGESITDIILAAWKDEKTRPSQAEIARAVGRHRQQVNYTLRSHGLGGYRSYPELDDPETFVGRSDAEIAYQLGIAESSVATARLGHGIKKEALPIDVNARRCFLISKLFGNGYWAGPRFNQWLKREAKKVLADPSPVLDFYVAGKVDTSTSAARALRWRSVKQLKEQLDVDVTELLEKGVICE